MYSEVLSPVLEEPGSRHNFCFLVNIGPAIVTDITIVAQIGVSR